jgi:hypothetical protein
MNVQDIINANPKAFADLENTLSQQFGLSANNCALKKDCKDDIVWGAGQRDDDAVVIHVGMDRNDPLAQQLPVEITADAGGKIPVLYTTSNGPGFAGPAIIFF